MLKQQFPPVATIPRARTPEVALPSNFVPELGEFRLASGYEDVERAVHRREQVLLVGGAAVHSVIERPDIAPKRRTTLDQLRAANEGNTEGYNGAFMNVYTAVRESSKKYANSVEVEGTFDDQMRFVQFDQTSDDFLGNALHMYGATAIKRAEARDMFRFEELVRAGRIHQGEQYHILSLIPKGTRQELADQGYFLESMSLVHRVMTLGANGSVRIRSNFIAGVDMQRVEQELGAGLSEHDMIARQERALELRHDHELAQQFYASIGMDLPDTSAETVLDNGFITPAGYEDEIVRRLDGIAASITGKKSLFYGTDMDGDYRTFLETSKRQAESFQGIAHTVMDQAQDYVRAGLITSPDQVPGLFRDLIKDQLVDRAIYCDDVDLRVLGTKAATHIVMAQSALMRGDFAQFQQFRTEAQAVAVLTDCPPGARKRNNITDDSDNQLDVVPGMAELDADDKESGECDYRIDSCYCSPYNIDGSDAPQKLEVRVIRAQSGDATCTRCTACISETGEVKNYGYIKARADMLKYVAEADQARADVDDETAKNGRALLELAA